MGNTYNLSIYEKMLLKSDYKNSLLKNIFNESIVKSTRPKRQFFRPLSYVKVDSLLALTQQATAFTICVLTEGVTSNLRKTMGIKSPPSLLNTIGSSCFIIVSILMIYSSGMLVFGGIFLGFTSTTFLFIFYLSRVLKSEDFAIVNFPGPRVWPTSLSILAFFISQTYFQLIADFLS